MGSGTGLDARSERPKARGGALPGAGIEERAPQTGLRPPADNSWDRREDFSAAHRARKSTREGAPSAQASQLPSSHERSEWRGGVGGGRQSSANTLTPTPNPSPQGGGEQNEFAESTSHPSGFSEAPQAAYT